MKGYRAKIPPGLYDNARPIALIEAKTFEDAVRLTEALNRNVLFGQL